MPSPDTSPDTAGGAKPRPWIRGLYMALFVLFFAVAETVLFVVAVVQFGWLIVYRERHAAIARFGASLSRWLEQVGRYQAAATEEKPFPWGDWPAPR